MARSAWTYSWLRMSATVARTVRVTMPSGITDKVITGSTIERMCCQSQTHSALEPSPMPIAGSTPSSTEKMITSTMPSQ